MVGQDSLVAAVVKGFDTSVETVTVNVWLCTYSVV